MIELHYQGKYVLKGKNHKSNTFNDIIVIIILILMTFIIILQSSEFKRDIGDGVKK